MSGWRTNRGFGACTAVVVIVSLFFFWLPVPLWVDITHSVAGFLGGRLAGTAKRGALAGVVGGVVVATVRGVLVLPSPEATGSDFVYVLSIPVYTTTFGIVGGWTGRTVTKNGRRIPGA